MGRRVAIGVNTQDISLGVTDIPGSQCVTGMDKGLADAVAAGIIGEADRGIVGGFRNAGNLAIYGPGDVGDAGCGVTDELTDGVVFVVAVRLAADIVTF